MVAVVVTVAAGEIIKTKDIGNEFFNVQCYIFSCCELSIKVHLTPKLFFGRDETGSIPDLTSQTHLHGINSL